MSQLHTIDTMSNYTKLEAVVIEILDDIDADGNLSAHEAKTKLNKMISDIVNDIYIDSDK